MIHEEICTYEVCKLAKERGFDWMPSMYFHSGVESDLRVVGVNGANPNKIPHSPHISCPTLTQLQRWLREEKKIYIAISVDIDHDLHRVCFEYEVCYDFDGRTVEYHNCYDSFRQYEDALEDALKYALENLI